jgi:PAS domain S-box-containing protein
MSAEDPEVQKLREENALLKKLISGQEISDKTNELNAGEQKFRQIIQASPMGMHMYELRNDQLVFTAANPAANHILGVDNSQFIGLTIEQAFPGLVSTEVPERYKNIAKHGTTWKTEQIDYSEGGIQGAFEVVAFQTEPGKMVTMFSDITTRKRTEESLRLSEERLAFALSATNDGIWDYRPAENKLFWSDRFYTMLGYEPGEFPSSYEKWKELLHPQDHEHIEGALNQCLTSSKDYYSEEGRLRNSRGQYQWFLLRGKVVARDASGKVLRMSGTHVDITERKLIYHELLKAKEKAEESDRLKSAFLANLSHEIRTPMNAIMGFSDLLLKDFITPDQVNTYLDIIQKSSRQLLSIISDIIEISQIETGQIRLHYSPVNLAQLMANLDRQFQLTIPENSQVTLNINTPSRYKDLQIVSDAVKLQQILTNLISNAIKYTEKGSVTVTFDLKNEQSIRFTVKDTGIGIDKKYHQQIFDRFRQVEGETAVKYGGSGLGLAISKAYVNMLNGEISVSSVPGEGSTFSFMIPVIQSQLTEAGSDKPGMKHPRLTKAGKILVAEDDENSYLLLTKMLTGTNIRLLRARNGVEAVSLCKSQPDIVLVIMDIKMPVMNGLEAARLIKKQKPYLPLIAQTAYALETDKVLIENAGFTGYFVKPLEKDRLIEMIEKLL